MSKWKCIPKVELHCHLEGCTRFSTLLEEAKRHGIVLPSSDENELRKYFLIEHQVEDLQHCLEIMDRQGIILADARTITRLAREAVIDKCDEGVKLIEFRYAPSYISSAGKSGLSFAEIHAAVKQGIHQGIEVCRSQKQFIYVGLICIAIPAFGKSGVEETVEFILENKKDFVGFDMAGCEMELIKYQRFLDKIHKAGIHITLHSGEERSEQSVNNVKDAIEKLHATRIGHGVNVFRSPEVYDVVKNTKTHLELCPISNVRTHAVDEISKHPVKNYLDDGLNVSVSTDDPRPFVIDSNVQFELLNQTFQFGLTEFFRLARNALDSSFVDDDVRDDIRQRFFSEEAEEKLLQSLMIDA